VPDYAPYLEGWRERAAAAARAADRRAGEARRLLPRLVDHLVRVYGVRRVVLFGSLAEGGFSMRSDIDLAVEGLSGSLFQAGADLDELAAPFRVDLVPLEDAWPAVVARVEETGEVLAGG